MKLASLALSAIVVGISVFSAIPANAVNTACPSGYTHAVIHETAGAVRAKACINMPYDRYAFSDTHADSWGANFRYPNSPMTGTLSATDNNGANNGWIYAYPAYPNGRTVYVTTCSWDYSAGVSHGCTTGNYYS